MRDCLIVARKEIQDHLRDTRSLVSGLVYALMGPAVVLLVSASSAAGDRRRTALLLSMASVFALVSAVAGGMNVALDAMAGERERRSLVPLLLTPVPRLNLVIGKWIAVSMFGLAALAVTIGAFLVIVFWRVPIGRITLASLSVWVVLGLIPLSLAASATHLLLAARSRTTQEAHNWLSLVVFVPMMAGMFLVFFPAWIGRWWFVAPIAGQQALAVRSVDGQPPSLAHALILAAVTILLAAPALEAARRGLERDDVVAG